MLTVILLLLLHFKFTVSDPIVALPEGLIQGREALTLENKTFYAFQKIPYAAPPVGELRFKPPQPPNSWNGTLDTKFLTVLCHQINYDLIFESEDCLYLNVYTPNLPNGTTNTSLPVLFYIHGGGFGIGTSIFSYPDLFINNDIVVVTINYRLGPFGFLSTQDEVIPGNNGLKDQLLALEWTHKNIHLFSGDSGKITIYGVSAGSASCSYLLLNPRSEGLFRGAILGSGSFLSPWAFQRSARNIAFTTATFLNSTFETNRDSQALLQFLQSVDARDLDAAAVKYYEMEYSPQDIEISQGFYWAPVLEVESEEAFLTQKMYGLLKTGNVVVVPSLIGIASEEGLFFNPDSSILKSTMESYDEHPEWLVPNDMKISDVKNRTEMGELIKNIYTGGRPLSEQLGDAIRYSSDTSFTRSIIKHAELYSKLADTYFYQFSFDGQLGHFDVHYEGADSVAHAEDVNYLFCSGFGCDITNYPESDQIVRRRMVEIWTNFIKYQNPTPKPSQTLLNITWPLVSTEDGNFFYVDIGEDLEIKNHPKKETYKKWEDLYNSLDYDDFDTY